MAELIAAAFVLALGWSWGRTGGLLAAAAGLCLTWAASRLLWPYKPCTRCKGTGRNPGSNDKRHGDCKRCNGARRVRRFGARPLHRLKLAILGHVKER